MQRFFPGVGAALAGLLILASTVSARVIAPAPIPDRVARVDVVVIGKVTSVDKTPVNTPLGEFRLATVKVSEALLGAKGVANVTVGTRPLGRRFPQLELKEGKEVCLFLTR